MKQNSLKLFISAITLLCIPISSLAIAEENKDFANYAAFKDKNDALPKVKKSDKRVVFMGDSITQYWDTKASNLFANPNYINRGISGQTSSQMLLRFRQDVLDLNPRAVVILTGTNDIAGNTGKMTPKMIMDNIKSMVEIAKANGVTPILCKLVPANRYYWNDTIKPVEPISELNQLIADYAKSQHLQLVDYFTPMVDENLGLKHDLGEDGVHPNSNGYLIMNELIEKAITKALKKAK